LSSHNSFISSIHRKKIEFKISVESENLSFIQGINLQMNPMVAPNTPANPQHRSDDRREGSMIRPQHRSDDRSKESMGRPQRTSYERFDESLDRRGDYGSSTRRFDSHGRLSMSPSRSVSTPPVWKRNSSSNQFVANKRKSRDDAAVDQQAKRAKKATEAFVATSSATGLQAVINETINTEILQETIDQDAFFNALLNSTE